jgi:predicted transcriptional regulator
VRMSAMSRSEIYRRLAAGDLAAKKNRSRTLILVESIKRYMNSSDWTGDQTGAATG